MWRKWAWSRPRLGWLTNWMQGAASAFQQQPDESFASASLSLCGASSKLANTQWTQTAKAWWVFPKLIWQNLDVKISEPYVYKEGSQASYQPWCCFSWFLSGSFPEEEEGPVRNVLYFPLKVTHEWLSHCCHQTNHWKIWKNVIFLRSDKSWQALRQKWYRGHQSWQAKLTLMAGITSRLCHAHWTQKDLFSMMLKQMSAMWVAMWMPLCFIFQSRKWVMEL